MMRNKIKYQSIADDQDVQCVNCHRILSKRHFNIRNLYEDGERGICCFCDWVQRHQNNFPTIDGWSRDEILRIVEFQLVGNSECVNDLQDILPQKTLTEICQCIVQLKIKRGHLFVRTFCDCCGVEIAKSPSVYLKNRYNYCSCDCLNKCRSIHRPKGEDSPFYRRIDTVCSNCGKPIKVIPYNFNLVNGENDHHNFCCNACYWEFRSKYYVGEKSTQYGIPMSDHTKDRIRESLIERINTNSHLNSDIQLLVNDILDTMEVNYEREKQFRFYAGDNYLTDYDLLIEVMGDYWHASPLRYGKNGYPISEKQYKWIIKDKEKHTYIKRHHNIDILYLWEHDIKKNPNLCRVLVQFYIDNQGNLVNYHSFNYHLEDNLLALNQELIIPYQDQSKQEYVYYMEHVC